MKTLTILAIAAAGGWAQPAQNFDNVEIHLLPVQGNIYMLVGAGGNITVQVGKQGVMLVDTQFAPLSDKIVAAIRKISDRPIRYILDTHVHADHTGGNEKLAEAGTTIEGGPGFRAIGVAMDKPQGAHVWAHENVLKRMSAPTGSQPAMPFAMWPTDTYIGDVKEFFFNGESVEMMHVPNAHTDGDSIVYFRRSDVISAGDIFVTTSFPIIDLQRGGSVQGVIDGLNRILDLAIPEHEQEGGTYIIPGHGRLCDEADVVEYRDMVTIIRDRIQDMIKRGMTLDQIKAAKPTLDYDARYGSETGFWTTSMFIEAVYRSLVPKG
jgi:cyclase